MATAEDRPVARDALDERFDEFTRMIDTCFDNCTKMIDRQFNRMMWVFGLGGVGVFAILGYIISRLP